MGNVNDLRIGVVTARFNSIVTARLKEGATELLARRGVSHVFSIDVPGSFEIPLAAQQLLSEKNLDGVICLGAVIRGATQHFDYVCSTCSSGLMKVQLSSSKPVGFGILTCETLEQAFDRAGGKLGNKGAETAEAVLEMIILLRGLKK